MNPADEDEPDVWEAERYAAAPSIFRIPTIHRNVAPISIRRDPILRNDYDDDQATIPSLDQRRDDRRTTLERRAQSTTAESSNSTTTATGAFTPRRSILRQLPTPMGGSIRRDPSASLLVPLPLEETRSTGRDRGGSSVNQSPALESLRRMVIEAGPAELVVLPEIPATPVTTTSDMRGIPSARTIVGERSTPVVVLSATRFSQLERLPSQLRSVGAAVAPETIYRPSWRQTPKSIRRPSALPSFVSRADDDALAAQDAAEDAELLARRGSVTQASPPPSTNVEPTVITSTATSSNAVGWPIYAPTAQPFVRTIAGNTYGGAVPFVLAPESLPDSSRRGGRKRGVSPRAPASSKRTSRTRRGPDNPTVVRLTVNTNSYGYVTLANFPGAPIDTFVSGEPGIRLLTPNPWRGTPAPLPPEHRGTRRKAKNAPADPDNPGVSALVDCTRKPEGSNTAVLANRIRRVSNENLWQAYVVALQSGIREDCRIVVERELLSRLDPDNAIPYLSAFSNSLSTVEFPAQFQQGFGTALVAALQQIVPYPDSLPMNRNWYRGFLTSMARGLLSAADTLSDSTVPVAQKERAFRFLEQVMQILNEMAVATYNDTNTETVSPAVVLTVPPAFVDFVEACQTDTSFYVLAALLLNTVSVAPDEATSTYIYNLLNHFVNLFGETCSGTVAAQLYYQAYIVLLYSAQHLPFPLLLG